MTTVTIKGLAAPRRAPPLPWPAIAALAVGLAYGDGFWLTALQGVIGAVERQEPPFARWVRDATLMLPLVFLAVLLALEAARRAGAGRKGAVVRIAGLALAAALAGGAVTMVEAGVSSALDYRQQVQHLAQQHGGGEQGVAGPGAEGSPAFALYCTLRGAPAQSAVAQLEYATLMLHLRALALFGAVVLATNLVLVGGVLAVAQLWRAPTTSAPSS